MNSKEHMRNAGNDDALALTVLQEIHDKSNVTQRTLARSQNVALGSINLIIKRLMNKGYVKITEVHPKRFLYFLTPKGFNEKSRLTLSYIHRSVLIYKDIKLHVERTVEEMLRDGFVSVALCGVDDGLDIVYLVAMEKGLKIAGIFDFNEEVIGKTKLGHVILDARALRGGNLDKSSGVLVASVEKEPVLYKKLVRILKDDKRIYSIV